MTLRTRIMVAFAYLLLLAVVALSVPLGINVARRARDDFAVQLNNRVEQAAMAVPEALEEGPEALTALVAEQPELGRVIVTDRDGTLLADSTVLRRPGRNYRYRPEIVEALDGHPTRLVREYRRDGLHYVVAAPVIDKGRVIGAVRINQPVAAVDELVRRRLLYLGAGSVAVLLMALLVSILIGRSLTRPLNRLGEVAARIGDGDLGARAPESGQREVADVAIALNSMSGRIEQMITAQTDFVANASHQLRTPLTGLRLRLEGLQAAGVEGAEAALAETDRLAALIDDLLTLVRAGTAPMTGETTDAAQAAASAVDRWMLEAVDRDHTLRLEGADEPRPVNANPTDLAIIFDNLIENALKYTPAQATVTVTVTGVEGGAVIAVADNGPGMSAEDRERAFDRFYRGTTGQAATGTGLGLAIVRQVVERWGGTVAIQADDGTCFEIYLPEGDWSAVTTEITDPIATPS